MSFLLPIGLALLAGMLLPLQAGINNPLRQALGTPLLPAFVTFSTGALALLAYTVAARVPFPAGQAVARIPWWNWVGGGLCGALFVTLMIALAPRLGGAVLFALIVAGEIGMSLALDHFGWLGFPTHALNPTRLAGAFLLVAGVILVERR